MASSPTAGGQPLTLLIAGLDAATAAAPSAERDLPSSAAAHTPDAEADDVAFELPVAQGPYARSGVTWARASYEDGDLGEVARKLNNPVGPLWLLFTQNDYTVYGGELVKGSKQARVNSFKLNPVMPVPISEDWNLILRPVLPFVQGDLPDPRTGELNSENGVGDSVLLAAFSPEKTSEGIVWGVGPTFIFPTASSRSLGSENWSAGPGGTVFYLGETWVAGLVAQQWWDVSGTGGRDGTNRLDLQYVLRYRVTPTFQIGMTPNIIADWEKDSGDRWTVPVGIGFDQTVRMGDVPVRIGLEYQRYVSTPNDFRPQDNVRLFFIPVIPNPVRRGR